MRCEREEEQRQALGRRLSTLFIKSNHHGHSAPTVTRCGATQPNAGNTLPIRCLAERSRVRDRSYLLYLAGYKDKHLRISPAPPTGGTLLKHGRIPDVTKRAFGRHGEKQEARRGGGLSIVARFRKKMGHSRSGDGTGRTDKGAPTARYR